MNDFESPRRDGAAAGRKAGRVFVLDPKGLAGLDQDWWWVHPITGIGDATRLMGDDSAGAPS